MTTRKKHLFHIGLLACEVLFYIVFVPDSTVTIIYRKGGYMNTKRKDRIPKVAMMAVVIIVGLGVATWAYLDAGEGLSLPPGVTLDDYPVAPGGETRPTLPPSQFSGTIASAYEIAQRIPAVLDGLYCYCDCELNFGHKSNLSCFVDTHASTCGICMNQAFDAYRHHQAGLSVDEIKARIDARYGRRLKDYGEKERAILLKFFTARAHRVQEEKG